MIIGIAVILAIAVFVFKLVSHILEDGMGFLWKVASVVLKGLLIGGAILAVLAIL